MCIYDNSITLLLCAFYASIQSNIKAIDITEMLWYYIITEERKTQRTELKASRKFFNQKQVKVSQSSRKMTVT